MVDFLVRFLLVSYGISPSVIESLPGAFGITAGNVHYILRLDQDSSGWHAWLYLYDWTLDNLNESEVYQFYFKAGYSNSSCLKLF